MKITAAKNFCKKYSFKNNAEKYDYTSIVLSGKEWKKVLINWGGAFDWSIPDSEGTFIEVPILDNCKKYRLATWVVNNRLMPVLLPVSKRRQRPIFRRIKRQGMRTLERRDVNRKGRRVRGD